MEQLLTGLGLSTAAGLNAYIPMLMLGVLARFTDIVNLPQGWNWLENGWVLLIVSVLLIVEIVADKIPALDSINDAVQTFVRPAAGGIVFGSGTAAQTAAVTDPGDWAKSGGWIPVAIGVVVALVVSLTKTAVRPAANVATAGVAAPVLSTFEDVTSFGWCSLRCAPRTVWSWRSRWRRRPIRPDSPPSGARGRARTAQAR